MVLKVIPELNGSILGNASQTLYNKYFRNRKKVIGVGCSQTEYRDNDAQTLPWEPSYTIKLCDDPEVLKILDLEWGNGLPAGMHEIEIINRRRMRRAWEAFIPPGDSPVNIKIRMEILTALELDELAFKDAELQFVVDLRMELAEEQMRVYTNLSNNRNAERFEKLDELLIDRKRREIKNIRNRFHREDRKLRARHGSPKKAHRSRGDIVKLHVDRGVNYHYMKPRYNCFHSIQNDIFRVKVKDEDVECPKWLFSPFVSSYLIPNKCQGKICLRKQGREQRKLQEIDHVLEEIQDDMKQSKACSLLKRKVKPLTPETSTESSSSYSILEQSSFVDLIQEIQSCEEISEEWDGDSQSRLFDLERDMELLRERRVNEIMQALEGRTVARQLNYLTEKMARLQKEREAHGVALLAEKLRIEREIVRMTKETNEINLRRDADEIFRQVTKANQECIQLYLDDVIKDAIEWVAENNAEKYIEELADKIDKMENYVKKVEDKLNDEGLIANLVYNFVLPEVEKELVKQNLDDKEKSYYVAAHAAVCDEILHLTESQFLCEEGDEGEEGGESEEEESVDQQSGQESVRSEGEKNEYLYIIEHILEYIDIPDDDYRREVCKIVYKLLNPAENCSVPELQKMFC